MLCVLLWMHVSVKSQDGYSEIPDTYLGIYDTMGVPNFILRSDRERWFNLKEGERVVAYDHNLDFIGYYRKNKKGEYFIQYVAINFKLNFCTWPGSYLLLLQFLF